MFFYAAWFFYGKIKCFVKLQRLWRLTTKCSNTTHCLVQIEVMFLTTQPLASLHCRKTELIVFFMTTRKECRIFYLSSVTLFSERDQPSVLYRLKCLFSVLSCSTKGKTCRVILITRARKGGQRQQDLSHPSWSLFSLWPEAHLHLLSWKPQSLMSYVRGWHLPSNCLLPTLQTNTITVNGLDRISQKHPPTLHRSHCSVRL